MDWLNSSDHPGFVSDLAALPPGTRLERRKGAVGVICEERPDFWFGNYLLLPTRPSETEAERARQIWHELFGSHPGVGQMIWGWEEKTDSSPSLKDADLKEFRRVVLSLDRSRLPPPPSLEGFSLRQATSQNHIDDTARLISRATGADEDFCIWRQRAYFGLHARMPGGVFALWEGKVPVATAGFWVAEGIGRFQEVVTDERYRRRGLATALCSSLIHHHLHLPEVERVVVVAERESPAERMYQRMGFQPASMQTYRIMQRET